MTADGEIAHKQEPCCNGRAVVVHITRGLYYGDPVIDRSYRAARELGKINAGVVPVDLEVLHRKQSLVVDAAADDSTARVTVTDRTATPPRSLS